MNYDKTRYTVKSICDKMGIAFFDSYSDVSIPYDKSLCIFHYPESHISGTVLNPFNSERIINRKHIFTLELTSKKDIGGMSAAVFYELISNNLFDEIKTGEIYLSAQTRLPSIKLSFCTYEIYTVDLELQTSERTFNGLGYTALATDMTSETDYFLPTLVLSTGEKYLGEIVTRPERLKFSIRLPTANAAGFMSSVRAHLKESVTFTVGQTGYGNCYMEKLEMLKSDRFMTEFRLTVRHGA